MLLAAQSGLYEDANTHAIVNVMEVTCQRTGDMKIVVTTLFVLLTCTSVSRRFKAVGSVASKHAALFAQVTD